MCERLEGSPGEDISGITHQSRPSKRKICQIEMYAPGIVLDGTGIQIHWLN